MYQPRNWRSCPGGRNLLVHELLRGKSLSFLYTVNLQVAVSVLGAKSCKIFHAGSIPQCQSPHANMSRLTQHIAAGSMLIESGVPQRSVLGPLLFNVFINDIFYAIDASEICKFADDNTIYALSHNWESIIAKLQIDIYNTLK